MSIAQHIPVSLLAADRSATLKAVLKDSAGTVVTNYVDGDFSALEVNGKTRVLAYEIPSAAFVGKLTIWLADGSKEIGTIYIEPDYQASSGGSGGGDLEIDASEGFQVIT